MKYGLALSGGGTRGAAHVGVLKALAENGMLPDAVAGTSAGSISAGLYATGMEIGKMEEIVLHLSKHGMEYLDPEYGAFLEFVPRLLSGGTITLSGLFKGDKLQEYFCSLTEKKQLDEAACTLAIPAVDLNTGNTIVFTNAEKISPMEHVHWEWEGYLCQAMMASASVPAVFAPRAMGPYLLVDGGVTDNLPVNLLRAAGISSVLAVDIGGNYKKPQDSSMLEVVTHSFSIMSRRLKECASEEELLTLKPPLDSRAGLLTFQYMESCMETAYHYTKQMLPQIRRLFL